jgi:chromosome segregation ATPase
MLENDLKSLKKSHQDLQQLAKQGHEGVIQGMKQEISRIKSNHTEEANKLQATQVKLSEKANQATKLNSELTSV